MNINKLSAKNKAFKEFNEMSFKDFVSKPELQVECIDSKDIAPATYFFAGFEAGITWLENKKISWYDENEHPRYINFLEEMGKLYKFWMDAESRPYGLKEAEKEVLLQKITEKMKEL